MEIENIILSELTQTQKNMHDIYSLISGCLKKNIECQFALERYMKCGIGVCGNCTCGKKRVCVEGPVFQLEDLPNLTDFNKTYRTKVGKAEKYG